MSLIQAQNGRYSHNWRRRNDPYPRFERLVQDFWRYFDLFRELLEEEKVPPLQIQQVELTYG